MCLLSEEVMGIKLLSVYIIGVLLPAVLYYS
jgi:hypothetical protein